MIINKKIVSFFGLLKKSKWVGVFYLHQIGKYKNKWKSLCSHSVLEVLLEIYVLPSV